MLSNENKTNTRKSGENVVNFTEKIRNKRHPFIYIFSFILLVIIVVTFVGGPAISGAARNTTRLIFGKYGKTPIEYLPNNYFARQREIIADQIEKDETTNPEYQLYQLWRSAYENTVIHTAILDMAKTSGFSVSDQRIDRNIIKFGPYTVNGIFDEEIYAKTSTADRQITRDLFSDSIQHDQVVTNLFQDLLISDNEKDFFKSMASPEYRFQYIHFGYADFPRSEVLVYAENNSSLFEKIQLGRITFAENMDFKEAEEIAAKIVEKELSFKEAAVQFSRDLYAEKGGDFGVRYAFDLESIFKSTEDHAIVMNLKPGELSPVLDTNNGLMVFTGTAAAYVPDFSNEDDFLAVSDYLYRYERGLVEDYLVEKTEQLRLNARLNSLVDASIDAEKNIYTTEFFPVNFGESFYLKGIATSEENSELRNAAYDREFLQKLVSVKKGDISEPLVLNEKVYLFELLETRTAPEEDLLLLDAYFDYIILQNEDQEFRTAIMTSPRLEDNFTAIFSEYFLSDN